MVFLRFFLISLHENLYLIGVLPVNVLNWTVKLLISLNPTEEAIAEIGISSLLMSSLAFAMRLESMYFTGLMPICFLNNLQK